MVWLPDRQPCGPTGTRFAIGREIGRGRIDDCLRSQRKEADLSPVVTQAELPLRGEPFSAEHLWSHAAEMAARHRTSGLGREDDRFIGRYESNCRFIESIYRAMTAAVREGEPLAPTAEWVLDNYHIVEEQLREIREDLPRRFYRELPRLADGEWAGFPRVYEVAHELVVHTDSSLDEELIAGFVESYQQT